MHNVSCNGLVVCGPVTQMCMTEIQWAPVMREPEQFDNQDVCFSPAEASVLQAPQLG